MSFLRGNEPVTEVPKKDIMNLAIDRMGDGISTWEWLRKLNIVQPQKPKFSFTITAELPVGTDPSDWAADQWARAIVRNRVTQVDQVQSVTEPDNSSNLNDGTVPVVQFVEWAKDVKKSYGYCNEFWDVVYEVLGVPKPAAKPVTVTLTLRTSDFEEAGIDHDAAADLSVHTLCEVLEELGGRIELKVTPLENN